MTETTSGHVRSIMKRVREAAWARNDLPCPIDHQHPTTQDYRTDGPSIVALRPDEHDA